MDWGKYGIVKPYYSDDAVCIVHADCRDTLPLIPDKSIDLLWTDPPYNVGKQYGTWDDNLSDTDYLAFCLDWIVSSKRAASELAIYVPTKYIIDYWRMLGRDYRQIILAWTMEGAMRFGFVNQFASILTDAKPKRRTHNLWQNVQSTGYGYFFKEDNHGHPGYTSEDLTLRVMLSFAFDNSLMLDPFLGSGTTAYCAKKLGRKCIGIEIEEKYCEIAAKRCCQSVMNFGEMGSESESKLRDGAG